MRKTEQQQGESDAFELVEGFPVLLKSKELHMGRQLDLLDHEGKPVASLKKNISGNPSKKTGYTEKSYTLTRPDGQEVLIPVPFFSTAGSFLIDVAENEDIQLRIPKDAPSAHYRFSETDRKDVSSVQSKIHEHAELTPEWQEFSLEDDQALVFYNAKKEVLARIYKVPHVQEYILRDPQGDVRARLLPGDQVDTARGKIHFELNDAKLRMRGEVKLDLGIEKFLTHQQIPTAESDFLKGLVNGGRKIAVASYREVGRVKEELLMRNEDNAGFNVDTVVVADGVGGSLHGALASSKAVKCLLETHGDFRSGIQKVHEQMVDYTMNYRILEQEEMREREEQAEQAWFDQGDQQSTQTSPKDEKAKPVRMPDTVMSAVRFEGNQLSTMVLGDCRVYVIRGDDIVFRSREHTVVADQLAAGNITAREALESGIRNLITTTVVAGFAPDYQKFELQKGDKVLLCSDGGDMPEPVIIACVRDVSVETGVQNLLEAKREQNQTDGAYYDPGDGKGMVGISSQDNTTYALIGHD